MELKYHGLYKVDDNIVHFRFGIENLISKCQSYIWRSIDDLPEDILESLKRFNNRAYWQCAKKTRETVFKLDKSITYLGKCIEDFEKMDDYAYNGASLEEASPIFKASGDIPYHFDSLISYLRILADCISFSIPFFYKTNKSIANRSFRAHQKWFVNKEPQFDTEYTQILINNTEWFEKLSGKNPKGIRDVIFHNYATYQYGYKLTKFGRKEIFVQQITSQGVKDPNLTYTITEIILWFFQYLDKIYELFGTRIIEEFDPYISKDLDHLSVFYKINNFEEHEKIYKFYPIIDSD